MSSDMGILAQKIWTELKPMFQGSLKVEAAQKLVDLFEEAGCQDLHECDKLMDDARVSVLDSNLDGEACILDGYDYTSPSNFDNEGEL